MITENKDFKEDFYFSCVIHLYLQPSGGLTTSMLGANLQLLALIVNRLAN